MHLHYQSNYSNEVHQLIVCVSKHLYVTKTGRIKYQQKAFDLSLSKVDRAEKEHLVHYLIRDHFSGVFYAEIHSCKALIPVEDFLLRAWSPKEDYAFCGVPECILVPKTVGDRFPSVNRLIEEYGLEPIEVTSGFQSGTIQDLMIEPKQLSLAILRRRFMSNGQADGPIWDIQSTLIFQKSGLAVIQTPRKRSLIPISDSCVG